MIDRQGCKRWRISGSGDVGVRRPHLALLVAQGHAQRGEDTQPLYDPRTESVLNPNRTVQNVSPKDIHIMNPLLLSAAPVPPVVLPSAIPAANGTASSTPWRPGEDDPTPSILDGLHDWVSIEPIEDLDHTIEWNYFP